MDTIETRVAATSAAHLALRRNSTGSRDDLTVVWSTRPVECEPGQVGHHGVHLAADRPPMVWDCTGTGQWEVQATEQCGACGTRIGPAAALYAGHLVGAALASAAHKVSTQAQHDHEAQREVVRQRLLVSLRDTLALDPADRADLPAADQMMEPGVGVCDDETLLAWAYDPARCRAAGEMIEVTEADLETANV